MPEDLMRYDLLAQEALRGVVRAALERVAKMGGLPGDHHFYIAFNTRHPEVRISDRIRQKYPREMTIVLQHQFEHLVVDDDAFEVELYFDNIREKLVIPFSAIKGFLDPSVQFGLQFEVVNVPAAMPEEPNPVDIKPPPPPVEEKPQELAETPKVVSLDAFRKK